MDTPAAKVPTEAPKLRESTVWVDSALSESLFAFVILDFFEPDGPVINAWVSFPMVFVTTVPPIAAPTAPARLNANASISEISVASTVTSFPAEISEPPLMPASIVLLMLLVVTEAFAANPAAAPIPRAMVTILASESAMTLIFFDAPELTAELSIFARMVFWISLSATAALPEAPADAAMLPANERMLALGSKDVSDRAPCKDVTTLSGSNISVR